MKYFLRFVLLTLLAVGAYFIYILFFTNDNSTASFNLVPDDAIYIIETQKPIKAWSNFSKSELWQHLKTYPDFAEITASADAIDQMIAENKTLFSMFGFKHLLISAHLTSVNNYDFLFITDLSKASRSSLVKDNLGNLFALGDYQVSEQTYDGVTVNYCKNTADKSTLYVAIVANYLCCSYNLGILKKSIDQYHHPSLNINPQFTKINNQNSTAGLAQVYINYRALSPFLKIYMGALDANTDSMFRHMHFTGLDGDLNTSYLKFQGYTNIDDSVPQLLTALSKSGQSKMGVHEILSEKTAFLTRLGFDDFDKFYNNLFEATYPKGNKKLNRNFRLIELFMGISIKNDLLGWMGNEISISQNFNEKLYGDKVPRILMIKAQNIRDAKEKMDKLGKKIRRRTPLKFNQYKFRDYDINYLETKGLFQMLFGKLFDRIEKPFFTYIGEYVVFCDDPRTLLQTIIDYEEGSTLAKEASFKGVYSDMDKSSSVVAYISPKLYYNNFKTLLAPAKFLEMNNNKQYITCFNGTGLQLCAKGEGMFETRIGSNFLKESITVVPEELLEEEALEALDEIDRFLIEQLNGNAQKKFYESGKLQSVTALNQDYLPEGQYVEYWENGAVKTKGRYKNGAEIGLWRYYNEEGKLIEKVKK